MNIEPGVPPEEKALRPFTAQEFLADEISEDLAAEELRQLGVVDPGDLAKDARLVHPALGHQEMEVRVISNPSSEGLNRRDDSGHQLAWGHGFEITDEGAEGTPPENGQNNGTTPDKGQSSPDIGDDKLAYAIA